MSFKNKAEIYTALLEGKKVYHPNLSNKYVHLQNGDLVDSACRIVNCLFDDPQRWELYVEDKRSELTKFAEKLVVQTNSIHHESTIQGIYSGFDKAISILQKRLNGLKKSCFRDINQEMELSRTIKDLEDYSKSK